MARPRKQIDPNQVETLAAINCTVAEIAAVIGCDKRTIERRFAADIEKGRDRGKSSLKRKMWETAMQGNVTMMIWMSKQMLGYSEKLEQQAEVNYATTYRVAWADEDPGNHNSAQTPNPATEKN